MSQNIDFSKIQLLVLDVDGVLTNADIHITENGEFLRTMNTKDGYGMKRLLDAGIPIAVITGGTSKGVELRLRGLGIETIYSGIHDKLPVLEKIASDLNISMSAMAYVGDDIPDLPCIQHVGIGCCPADGVQEILDASQYIAEKPGGRGCVREIIEHILRSQNKWN
ncbi:KdsC family phosphatase [Membranihabitans marinus]|uniref:KdsC family phosphatase n=1 Tax=Membranihabitans marinus TaxID=1227546 RepID=UPI001F451EB0|nr:HAD hydrolase family protein [Membranihabitans marinus]